MNKEYLIEIKRPNYVRAFFGDVYERWLPEYPTHERLRLIDEVIARLQALRSELASQL